MEQIEYQGVLITKRPNAEYNKEFLKTYHQKPDVKEKSKLYNAVYYAKKKEIGLEKIKVKCECGGSYSCMGKYSNKSCHEKSRRHQNFINGIVIEKKQITNPDEIITCPICNGKFKAKYQAKHAISYKHQIAVIKSSKN